MHLVAKSQMHAVSIKKALESMYVYGNVHEEQFTFRASKIPADVVSNLPSSACFPQVWQVRHLWNRR